MQPLISVIVPIYNAALYLDKCINSILNQTYAYMEIILVDDGSKDESLSICKKWEQNDDRVKVIHNINSGVSSARNIGLDACNGDYITFVDADDYIDPDYCNVLLNSIIKSGADISFCFSHDRITQNDKEKIYFPKEYNFLAWDSHTVVWGALFKKGMVQKLRFDTDLFVGEDTLFCAKAIKRASKIIHTHKKLYHYVQHEDSAVHGAFDQKKYTELESWRRVCVLYENMPDFQWTCKAAYAIRCRIMLRKYYGTKEFTKNIYSKVLKEYRSGLKYLITASKEIKIGSKIKFIAFALSPKLYMKMKLCKLLLFHSN